MKIVWYTKAGTRDLGTGYWWDEPNDLTIHVDLWWLSLRWEIRR